MRGIVWLKKDLRLRDNPALYQACKQCDDGVVAIYIIDPELAKKNSISAWQTTFIADSLLQLQNDLAEINVSFLVAEAVKTADVPNILYELAQKISAEKIFYNHELEINESQREKLVVDYCVSKNIAVEQFDEQLILPYESVRTGQGDYFKVFTPFKRAWLNIFRQGGIALLPKPKSKNKIEIISVIPASHHLENWPAGEKSAEKLLNVFIKNNLFNYDQQRDFPALSGTSQLSPYLATGMISAKTCFLAALMENKNELDSGNQGALIWMSELIWREFYRHILLAAPRVCMNQAYKLETEKLPWSYDENLLQAWQQGKTGFPIVDAAMRQLNTTGWMHNRLRMVTAMFLSKNLFLDWRLGEKYFAENLIDIDFASNNGGWQWSASTGTDAVPYFRIFNPTTQGQRFDAEGQFIREFCPKLQDFDKKAIHEPYHYQPDLAKKMGYPLPIIDYKKSRARVILAFSQLK